VYKLPVFATVGETYRFIAGQLLALVDYILVPVIFATVFATLIFFSTFTQTGELINVYGIELEPDQIANLPQLTNILPTRTIFVLSFLIGIVNVALYILFMVAWHRRYLLGPAVTSPREIFIWRARHWRFLGNGILVALIMLLAALVIAFPLMAILNPLIVSIAFDNNNPARLIATAITLNVIVGIPMALIACRLVLALPAAAIEERGFGIGGSINLTRRNTWRIVLVFLLAAYLPYSIISWGISWLMFTPFILKLWIQSLGLGTVALLLQQVVIYAGIAIGVSTLSIIYKKLADNAHLPSQPVGGPGTV